MTKQDAVAGLVLAGGLARRMGGGAKALQPLAGRPLVVHVLDRVGPQCAAMALNVNSDPAPFEGFGLPILPDIVQGFAGPLAGVLTGLDWLARERADAEWLVSVPTDAPFLPTDLVARLLAAARSASTEVATARSGGRTHPVASLWHRSLLQPLKQALVEEDVRKIDAFTGRRRTVHVDWDTTPRDPFFNVNRPEDIAEAERLVGL